MMFSRQRRLRTPLTLALTLVVSVAVWLPLVAASQTPVAIARTPVPDQQVEVQIGEDVAADAYSGPVQLSAPFFNALCDSETGLWAQTLTAGATVRLADVDLLLLRRSADVEAPVSVEIRAVDDAGQLTPSVLGRGATQATIPVHRAQPAWLTVSLDAPVQLLRGQKVAIFPTSSPSASGACYEWVSGGLDVYSGGAVATSYDLGATFAVEGGRDAAFRTWTR
jgi:hypothetical protein